MGKVWLEKKYSPTPYCLQEIDEFRIIEVLLIGRHYNSFWNGTFPPAVVFVDMVFCMKASPMALKKGPMLYISLLDSFFISVSFGRMFYQCSCFWKGKRSYYSPDQPLQGCWLMRDDLGFQRLTAYFLYEWEIVKLSYVWEDPGIRGLPPYFSFE